MQTHTNGLADYIDYVLAPQPVVRQSNARSNTSKETMARSAEITCDFDLSPEGTLENHAGPSEWILQMSASFASGQLPALLVYLQWMSTEHQGGALLPNHSSESAP